MTTQTSEITGMNNALSAEVLGQLFENARTTNTFTDEPVDVELISKVYQDLRWAPTAMNVQPLRLTVVTLGEAREWLVEQMAEGNQAKTGNAPLTVIAAFDPNWHEHMPYLAPHRDGAREQFAGMPEARVNMGRTNATIQVGYFILALRGYGLQVGPMAGFDAAGVDEVFHNENRWQSLAVLNIGHAPNPEDPVAQRPRAGRLDFEQAAQVL